MLLLVVRAAPKCCPPPRRRHFSPISAIDLLSTSTRWIPQLSSVELTLVRPPLRTPQLGTHACTNVAMASSTGAPDSRKRHLRPQVAPRWVPRTPAVTMIHASPLGAACRRDGTDLTYAGLCGPWRKPRGLITDAPCRTAFACPLAPTWSNSTKGPFHRQRTNATAFRTRSAFHLRVPLCLDPCWRWDLSLESRHWCLGLATSAQLPTRVRAQRYAR